MPVHERTGGPARPVPHPPPPGCGVRPGKRVTVGALLLGAAGAALAPAGPDALMPFRDAAAAAAEVSVGFVIDFGKPADVVVGCVKVPEGQDGYQALADFLQQEHESAATYNSSGLLCSIDEVPSTGCGQVVSGGYIYWSYWLGTSGTWSYATTGASGAVQNGDVEGWRFEDPGRANPSDPPPGASPDFDAICATPPPTTTTTAVTPTTAAPTTQPSAAVPGSASPQAPATSVTQPSSSTSRTGATARPTATSRGTGTSAGPGTNAPATTHDAAGAAGRSTGAHPASPAHQDGASSGGTTEAVGDLDAKGGGQSPVPLVVGGAIVAVLLAAAGFRWRRRAKVT